ncbi:hypothetical protein [Halalkalicoccus subterraneus]|uniref:hypothetical protein n=1 Tax=Halalkalicoccus subterraneus TaxID=2675002 RepID=UPI000EFA4692|nr:hypothetical protein [Halalkalicoccus subterraneus]
MLDDYFSADVTTDAEKTLTAAREERKELLKIGKGVFGPGSWTSENAEKSTGELEAGVFGSDTHPVPRSK